MTIPHYISFNSISEIITNQKNPWVGTIVITILDFTYIKYCKIVANMAHTALIIACQPLKGG